ncbi:MAG: cell division protein ZapA [Dissulfurispiraceae bacterium]|jgi:cell division protein ZapA|nr:cell division protein ZapA [Dissulfurispiraceae bacterium]
MGSVEVFILGQRYLVKGDEDPEYIKKLAEYVDTKLKEVHNSMPGITPLKASILASLTIADEMHKIKSRYNSVSERIKNIEDRADSIIKLFD